MKMIFLGPPGAGKGTQASGVSQHCLIPHISTGDMLRAAVRNETPTGLRAKAYMDAGKLVPDEVLIDMVKERLSQSDCVNGYLLDGFPRTVNQAEALKEISEPDLVIEIDVPDEKLLTRLTGRRVCPDCKGTYHISKLDNEGICPDCGGKLIHRDDDKPETIQKRLDVYHAQTYPLIEYYTQNGKLRKVDGDRNMDCVLTAIIAVIEGTI